MAESKPPHLRPRWGRLSTFWVVNLAFWGVLCVLEQFVFRPAGNRAPRFILIDVLVYGAGLLTTLGLRRVYDRMESRSMGRLSLLVLAWSFVGINVWFLLQVLINFLVFPRESELSAVFRVLTSVKYLHQAYAKSWPLLLWSAGYFVWRFWTEWRRAQTTAAEAAVLAAQAQLQMLRYQINPHFLFNSLNSIRSLVDESPEATKAMITDLAEFLRYSLAHPDCGEVSVGEELEAIRYYLAIQKRRYEDKLEVRWIVDEAARSHRVPSFLIHPLVENAVKYGMQTSPLPLRLTMEAREVAADLVLAVRNTGSWIPPKETGAPGEEGTPGAWDPGRGTGTGLENVRRRLENAYPERHSFEIGEESGQVTVTLVIRGTSTGTA
jgi:uncharacterized protein with PQ loop repeat